MSVDLLTIALTVGGAAVFLGTISLSFEALRRANRIAAKAHQDLEDAWSEVAGELGLDYERDDDLHVLHGTVDGLRVMVSPVVGSIPSTGGTSSGEGR